MLTHVSKDVWTMIFIPAPREIASDWRPPKYLLMAALNPATAAPRSIRQALERSSPLHADLEQSTKDVQIFFRAQQRVSKMLPSVYIRERRVGVCVCVYERARVCGHVYAGASVEQVTTFG